MLYGNPLAWRGREKLVGHRAEGRGQAEQRTYPPANATPSSVSGKPIREYDK